MGKRELLLILAFVAVGALAYRVAAPPTGDDEPGLGWSAILSRIRGEFDGRGPWVDRRLSASAPVSDEISEIDISGFVGALQVTGTDELEAHAELTARVRGSDEAEATARAERLDLTWRVVGESLTVEVRTPPGRRRYRGDLVVRVPAHLPVRLDAREGPIAVRGVAALTMSARGDTEARDIAGTVTGEHEGGELRLAGVGGARLDTRRSDVRAENVGGAFELESAGGRVRVRTVGGSVTLRTRRADVDVEDVSGTIDIAHSDGRLVLEGVRSAVTVQAQRSDVSLRIDEPVLVDLTARERATEVFLPAQGGVTLEAIVREGEIRLDGLALAATGDARERRVVGPIGGGGPRIALTVDAGDLVVRRE